jgi:hypothetical protein
MTRGQETTRPTRTEGVCHRAWKHHLNAMWAGLHNGVPVVSGYSGFRPGGWQPRHDAVLPAPDAQARLDGALADRMGRHGAGTACRVDVGVE